MRFISRIALVTAVALGVAAAAALYIVDHDGRGIDTAGASAKEQQMTMPVPVTQVVKKTIPIYLEYSARTESIRNITLQARVAGYLQAQLAPDGADVKQDDLLYQIDTKDLQASLDQADAQAQRDLAALDYARSNFNRGTELAKTGWVAKDTYDQRVSAMRQAEAALAMDQAAIQNARLNLGYAQIRAPFPGRLGRNQAPVGTLVSVGGTVLNTLVQLDPIYVTFNPSETDLVVIQKARASGDIEANIFLPGERLWRQKGKLTFVDNVVDRLTGTVAARATIANSDFTLLPGQYVKARLHVGDQVDALLVPQTALGSSQLGKYVYVVGAENKVEQRLVTLGPPDGTLISVVKGLAEGDQVIVGNLQKIGPGMPIQPVPKKETDS